MFLSSKALIKIIVSVILVICMGTNYNVLYLNRSHGPVHIEDTEFIESARQLENPNRGFYMMYGFVPSDEKKDVQREVLNKLQKDERLLAMIQINLRNYSGGAISEQGLAYIDEIFQALEKIGKQYIVRFLYDWSGKNMETEPQDVNIILEHMRQLEKIFRQYEDIIFIHQGLFIGNWGEMNGTIHLNYLTKLALQLEAVTGEKTYLAVRMPAQWRKATGIAEITEEAIGKSSLVRRLSLFNDGIMGNSGDYGTYSSKSRMIVGDYSAWNREEELCFQEMLCEIVPNGGEVIIDNPLNDFENALCDFKRMHLTYLNWDYDKNVLDKWARSRYIGNDCYNGMDGLSYIERHLGYRLLIAENSLGYQVFNDRLSIEVALKNVGFAPLYKEPECVITIQKKETGDIRQYKLSTNLCMMAGGNKADNLYDIEYDISLDGFIPGEYEVYFSLRDKDSKRQIQLANEQNIEEYGYLLGKLFVDVRARKGRN